MKLVVTLVATAAFASASSKGPGISGGIVDFTQSGKVAPDRLQK